VVEGEISRFCEIEEYYKIQMSDGMFHFVALARFYPKDSETVYWRLLRNLLDAFVVVKCQDFRGNFILFDGDGKLKIGVRY